MPLHTLHHDQDRTEQPGRNPDHDWTAAIAAAYPEDTPRAQQLLAETAVALLREAGHDAALGRCVDHTTAEVRAGRARLVLVPMADLWDLDAELAIEDDRDPALWHLMVRDGSGTLVETGLRDDGCPSVVWAIRAGIDPAAALHLVNRALGDRQVRALLHRVAL